MAGTQHPSHRRGKTPNIASSSSEPPFHSTGFVIAHHARRSVAIALTAVLVFAFTFIAASYADISSTIAAAGTKVLGTKDEAPIDPNDGKPIDIVVIGQDTRNGAENTALAGGIPMPDEHEADTTMIAQISANRKFINLVSIPRDTIVDAPACQTSNGVVPARDGVMFNSIFATGYQQGGDVASAANCTVTALRSLTGLPLHDFIVVDFAGLQQMINAIGGVDLCIPENISDSYTNLHLSKGWQHLNGTLATEYARVRHGTGVGDSSDIMRTARQQYLVKMLARQVMQKNILSNSNQLYQLAKAALRSLQMSEGLAHVNVLAGLAYSLKDIKPTNIYSRTAPTKVYPLNPNRVIFDQTQDDKLWANIRADKPLFTGISTTASGSDTTSSTNNATAHTGSSSAKTTAASTPSSSSSSSSSSSGSSSSSSSSSNTTQGKYDPKIGLIVEPDGTLIDPQTGGVVNPKTGTITDPNTGFPAGIAETYLNEVVCGVPAQK